MKYDNYILCVDDDQDDCSLLEESIKRTGKSIILEFVPSGQEALEFLIEAIQADNLPSLIILDINMPKLTGSEILPKIRNVLKITVPVLFFTTFPRNQDIELGEKYEASLLVKPTTLEGYNQIVKTIFDSLLDL